MKGIDKRISQDGSISYRARVRIKGHPPVIKTFNSLTIAKKWKKDTEVDIRPLSKPINIAPDYKCPQLD